ncbi:type II secretion system F family protein [Amnibacterium setariae]|uniref:Type II secretion system F family protein n=1 Tax=Amnibacterium setariae TaxID=2306585 RepID=A0A3A1U3T2_9MICO|nr:type II secretion system F family protein [Amnibacterium setariae]RIX30980.1 type II secretion system F family protein [Amnibacterium setariae]
MTPELWAALALGLVGGIGLWSLSSRVPSLGRPRLAARLAPALADVSPEARRLLRPPVADPVPVLGLLATPALDLFRRAFGGLLGGDGGAAVRLARAGRPWSVEGYRLRQLLWAVAGGLAGAALGTVSAVQSGPAALVAGPVVGVVLGPLVRDRLLVAEGDRRAARIESELPTVLEFLALSLSAGEGVRDALRRVARVGSGTLADLLQRVVDESAVGVPLPTALTALADELRIPALTRTLTHVVAALERGSPLAEVLRVQASDAREHARRTMLEAAGRKEIGMMVPLVFLILPVTVAFAVFPGILVLQTQL